MCSRKVRMDQKIQAAGGSTEGGRAWTGAAVLFRMCLAVCGLSCMLGGCTRREQLVLETAGYAGGGEESEPLGERQSFPGQEAGEEGLEQGRPEDGMQSDDGRSSGQNKTRTDSGEQMPADSGQDGRSQTAAGQAGPETDGQSAGMRQSGERDVICVHVCGAVNKSGVYELPAGSRVYEAVREAGGFAENADESYVNQAQQLNDGVKLVIPTMQQVQEAAQAVHGSSTEQIGLVAGDEGYGISGGTESPAGGAGQAAQTASPTDDKININTASEAQLCEIPGIGATRAAAIAAYRQEHGGFSSIEEIMNVTGIKEGTYAKMKDRIKVE